MKLDAVNSMPIDELHDSLCCCGSQRWVEAMICRRPFASDYEFCAIAEQTWQSLDHKDWLEAFAAHPRIGDLSSIRSKFGTTADLCHAEQSNVADANEPVLRDLVAANRQYEDRFGHIFIVCAAGKSAAEMLAILQSRLGSTPADELRIAAGEQWKITRLRLEKL